jgi:peptidyl-prolyl cis-trans isomerase SurA
MYRPNPIYTSLHYLLFTACVFFGIYLSSERALAYEPLDKAVAIVEDSIILESELQQRLKLITAKQPSIAITDRLRKQVLDQLILEQLQLQMAERVNLSISASDIDNAIINLQNRLQADNISFAQYLSDEQLNENELRTVLKKEITLQRIQEGNINRRIRVTDREIDDFLESSTGQDWLKTRFRLAHILLPVDGADDASTIAKAQELLKELQQSSADFGQMAATYSKGPNANKGGDLGWRSKEELPGLFIEQVANLKPGAITPPFRSNAGVHILKVLQRSGAEPVMVTRYKVRHILIKPTALFSQAEAKAKIDTIYQRLQNGEDFSTLAKEFTEDVGSKNDGGDLGWSTPNQFVPEFEQTMKTTAVGAISQPFLSQFGWHILKVDDSRVEDMFETVKRNQVANILRKRRFQDELQLWLQELREDAYVDVLI